MIYFLTTISEVFVHFFFQCLDFFLNIPQPNRVVLSDIDQITDNKIVLILVLFLHILYLFLLDYCKNWDKIDNFMLKKAIEINGVPFGYYKYLVTIYTSWRPRSGTKSKIILQLHGNLCKNTIFYYLYNPYLPYRKLFNWGDISFFILNTAIPVGDIQALTIGHDNSIDSSWFLSKVLVKDLQTNKSFRFFAHCWLKNNEKNLAEINSIVTLKPVDPSYKESFAERVFEWVRRCYRERPLMSFIYLNLLTFQTRVTRLNITYFYVILSMLVNMMYFDKSSHSLYHIIITSSIKTVSTYCVLLLLQYVFSFDCFTTYYPSKRQLNIRKLVYIIFFFLYLSQLITLLMYSAIYKDDVKSTLSWLGLFLAGMLQSEFLYSLIAAFSKAIILTFFSKDPFQEESANIIYIHQNKALENFLI